jgi:hypothetical protein
MEPIPDISNTDDDTIANHLVAAQARRIAENVTHLQLKQRYINVMVNAAVWRRSAQATSNPATKLLFLNEGHETLLVEGIEAYKSKDGKTIIIAGNPAEAALIPALTLKDLAFDIDTNKGLL